MKPFDVYPLFPLHIERASGSWVVDDNGQKYLDFYGGHAVISIGHDHPTYRKRLEEQLQKIGFYSNSVINNLQDQLAQKLGKLSGFDEYDLFLVNSGAEANENALKLASFRNRRSSVISFLHGFHGRTSAAVQITDNEKIQAPINTGLNNIKLSMGDETGVMATLRQYDVCAIVIEGIQGIAGIYEPTDHFLQFLRKVCDESEVSLILDEVQSGYGRSGSFFAFERSGIKPDLITVAKGMGNGFPIGGVLIHPEFEASYGLLGTTFGGNHLACSAGLAVLEVLATENLIEKAGEKGEYLRDRLQLLPGLREIRGRGLMLGLEMEYKVKDLRSRLLFDHHLFVGSSSNPYTLRLLPPLTISFKEIDHCIDALEKATKIMS